MLDPEPEVPRTETFAQTFSIRYDYPVHFTRDLFDPRNPCLRQVLMPGQSARPQRLAVFVDEGVTLARPRLAGRIADYAAAHAADAVGFAAAIFHRGVRHIRCPTTVLAQSDSGVGVKNAINAFGLKNLLGTFAPPFAVINDQTFLDVLPARDKRAGMAEAVKVALIRDGAFFDWIEREAAVLAAFEPNALKTLVRRCARLHMRQIACGGDPFESGSARPLDFGHWSAHKLETLTRHALRHGEAVAIGIALDSRYSVLAGLLPEGEDTRIVRLLQALGFTLWDDALDLRDGSGRRRIIAGIGDFQEHLGGELTVTLLAAIGHGVEVHTMDEELIERAIEWLRTRPLTGDGMHASRSLIS
ncbi:MAG: 3-dehydroquinate synthase [Alphaproteobacteria bacterium]|nr:MAG: 3-dehydroquinate synthase [Alphaproteobacteria bacterium]